MKGNWLRKIAIAAAVALSFAPILPRMGRALATVAPADFSLTGGKAEVTHEVASCDNETSQVISCEEPYWDSDSYEVNAGVDAANSTDLGKDVTTNGLLVAFLTGSNCTALEAGNFTGHLVSLQVIPGNEVHTTVNSKFTIYAFEGNVPQVASLFNGEVTLYDHLEMNLKIPNSNPANSALHLEANANFCDWANSNTPTPVMGPVTMVFDIGDLTEGLNTPADIVDDTDLGCVDLTPEYSTKDITSAACTFIGP